MGPEFTMMHHLLHWLIVVFYLSDSMQRSSYNCHKGPLDILDILMVQTSAEAVVILVSLLRLASCCSLADDHSLRPVNWTVTRDWMICHDWWLSCLSIQRLLHVTHQPPNCPTVDALTTATCSYGQSFTMDVTIAFGQLMICLFQHRGNIINLTLGISFTGKKAKR